MESMCHEWNSFCTFTYSNWFIYRDWQLHQEDMQRYFKRLRKRFEGKIKIKYYYSGEYGGDGRPHYHVALFGLGFPHAKEIKEAWNCGGWSMGRVSVDELNPYTARYISGYIMKFADKDPEKIKDKKLKERINDHLQGRKPEFSRMSRNGGIGKDFAVAVAKKGLKKNKKLINRVNYGKRDLYFDKYLRDCMDEVTGFNARKELFDQYTFDLFAEYNKDGIFNTNQLVLDNKQRANNRKKRMEIFRKRRKLCGTSKGKM